MATNGKPGNGRHGEVRECLQTHNPKKDQWVKQDT